MGYHSAPGDTVVLYVLSHWDYYMSHWSQDENLPGSSWAPNKHFVIIGPWGDESRTMVSQAVQDY